MRLLPIVFLGFLLTLSIAAATFALLPACGVRLPFFGTVDFCAPRGVATAAARLESLAATNADLSRRIAALERELGAVQCTRVVEAPPAPLLPPPAPPAPEPDSRAWDEGDVARLEGCWSLDSPFQTTDERSGVVSHYSSWRMCFGADGSGTEEMRADTGATCSGPVTGRLEGGDLVIEEPGNLQCSGDSFIYRMVSRCTPNPDGTAVCQLTQPEIGSAGTVSFRRAEGDN